MDPFMLWSRKLLATIQDLFPEGDLSQPPKDASLDPQMASKLRKSRLKLQNRRKRMEEQVDQVKVRHAHVEWHLLRDPR